MSTAASYPFQPIGAESAACDDQEAGHVVCVCDGHPNLIRSCCCCYVPPPSLPPSLSFIPPPPSSVSAPLPLCLQLQREAQIITLHCWWLLRLSCCFPSFFHALPDENVRRGRLSLKWVSLPPPVTAGRRLRLFFCCITWAGLCAWRFVACWKTCWLSDRGHEENSSDKLFPRRSPQTAPHPSGPAECLIAGWFARWAWCAPPDKDPHCATGETELLTCSSY